jgi:NitT/TauT family transport system ATP-binding protein
MLKVDIKEKRFGEKLIFKDFVLSLPDKGIYAVTGESGRGKTTLLNIIAGLDRDFKGSREADGRMSYVFQEDRLIPSLNVLENVMFVCRDREKAVDLLQKLGLGNETGSKLGKLSGGMKRRVAIARALAADYDLLLMDEPFASIDEERKQSIMDVIKETASDRLVIFVTHDIAEAEYLGAEVIAL